MRTLIFAFAVTVASVASAQYPGGVVVLGPWQPSQFGGYYFSNPSVPRYTGPLALYGDYGYDYATARELRRIRWELEDSRVSRRRR
jgi:hypothetical protein